MMVPRIQFNGFKEEWRKCKLGDISKIERGGSPRPIKDYLTDSIDGLNWIKISDAPEHGSIISNTQEKIKPEGLSKTRIVLPGDLILSNSMSFGKPYIVNIIGCIHDGWLGFKYDKRKLDTIFLCHLLGTKELYEQYKKLAAGSIVNNLNKELIENVFIFVPSLPEQRLIGSFFRFLDELIESQERRVRKLRGGKTAFLNSLFPKDGERFPKFRFPGFTEEWQECSLGDVVKLIGGNA